MMKLVNISDLKSDAVRLPGASPGEDTTYEHMENNNKKKSLQLGINASTANGQLRKAIMFHMAIQLKQDTCYRCNNQIKTIEEFSIEHKDNWLDSIDPKGKFFDLNNIAFSHLKCNVEFSRKRPKLYANKKEKNKARHVTLKNNEVKYQAKLTRKRNCYHARKTNPVDANRTWVWGCSGASMILKS